MSYATVAELRKHLKQLPLGDEMDAELQTYLDRATSVVEEALRFITYAAYPAASNRDVQGHWGVFLTLPAHEAGSVTAVSLVSAKGTTSETTEALTDYDELSDGRLYRYLGWDDAWYRVNAKWGYGPAPAAIVEVTCEIAVNLWRGKDQGGYSDVVGVEGTGAVGYEKALTARQKLVIEAERRRFRAVFV